MIGSSIVYWASRRAAGRAGGPHPTIHWFGKRGMKWGELIPSIKRELLSYSIPDVLLIQLGSNDIGEIKGKELIELVRLDILCLRTLFPNLKIVWSEILPRRYWHVARNQVAVDNTRKRVNAVVKQIILNDFKNACVIRHPNIKVSEMTLFRYDGVHL